MTKPVKKKRPADPNMRMHSILQDVIGLTNQPIKRPTQHVTGQAKRKKP